MHGHATVRRWAASRARGVVGRRSGRTALPRFAPRSGPRPCTQVLLLRFFPHLNPRVPHPEASGLQGVRCQRGGQRCVVWVVAGSAFLIVPSHPHSPPRAFGGSVVQRVQRHSRVLLRRVQDRPCDPVQGIPYTLHPTPYTLHPTPYTLHPTPYALRLTPCALHTTPYALNPYLRLIYFWSRLREGASRATSQQPPSRA